MIRICLVEATLETSTKTSGQNVSEHIQQKSDHYRFVVSKAALAEALGYFYELKTSSLFELPFHASLLLLIGGIALSVLLQMDDSKEEEEEASEEFNLIPPYSEKNSNTESSARGSQQGKASQAALALPLLLLPTLILGRECWNR